MQLPHRKVWVCGTQTQSEAAGSDTSEGYGARLTGKLTLLKHKKRENHRSDPPSMTIQPVPSVPGPEAERLA